MTIVVTLTTAEMILAANVAIMRQICGLKYATPKYGAKRNNGAWESHIIGALGEMAVAKHSNLYWNGTIKEFDKIDVGGLIEVRTAQNETDRLVIHSGDKDDLPFVLVIADPPNFRLAGWLYGRDGKHEKYTFCAPGRVPAFFVPQSELRPMDELRFP